MALPDWEVRETKVSMDVTVGELVSLLMRFDDDTILAAVDALVNYVEDDDALGEWECKIAAAYHCRRAREDGLV